MKADTQYSDLVGTAAADIEGKHGTPQSLSGLEKYFKLDTSRFTLVGLSIYGTHDPSVSLLCVDKDRSTDESEHIVKMVYDVSHDSNILDILFQRLHIVLYKNSDKKYPKLDCEEVVFTGFHDEEKEGAE